MPNDIFTADELEADQTGADVELKADEQQQETRERDEHGRFKAKEGEEEDGGEGEQQHADDGKTGTVPQGALHAEREKRKASDARADAVEKELAAAREVLAGIAKQRDEIAARKPADLPAADDPAATEHLRTRLAEIERNQTRFGQQQDMQQADARERAELGNIISASDAKFREVQPDYDDAITHLVTARAQELAEYNLPPAQIQAAIVDEVFDIVRTAVSLGKDPAELGYKIAISRGYRPAQGEQKANGKAAETLAAIAAARAGGRSLGQAAGATPQQLNAEAIAALSTDEFEELYSTPEGRVLIDNL